MTTLAKNPKHPCAAMLWIDWVLDPEGGQKAFKDVHYIPAHPKYSAELAGLAGKPSWVLGEEQLKDAAKWKTLLTESFLR
jgi:ABC-type Fe3+ transport system substrate-binding protein